MTKVLDLTKPVQTRDGEPVRILATDAKGSYPVVGLVYESEAGEDEAEFWTAAGHYYAAGMESGFDLVNVPEKLVGYLNVYGTRSQYGQTSYRLYGSRAIADAEADDMRGRIACIRVECEEGRFDD